MRRFWLFIGCFLIGYNYRLVMNSSEVAVKSVRRYTSAILIVSILWAFVGYTFTQRYLQGGPMASILGATISVIIIVQIERQIILSAKRSRGLYWFRGGLALMMALIGASIIDQVLLKQDIELEKIGYIQNRVDSLLPAKTTQINAMIAALDTGIRKKEVEQIRIRNIVNKHPVVEITDVQTNQICVTSVPGAHTADSGVVRPAQIVKKTTVTSIKNPIGDQLPALDSSIVRMQRQKYEMDSQLLNIRPALENDISARTGFLDDLKIMASLVSNSKIALFFWLLWIIFLLCIEMLVLFSKISDKENDYDKTILHQMELQNKKLEMLARTSLNNC